MCKLNNKLNIPELNEVMELNMVKNNVLFVTRPIISPWNEGSKKFSYDLANNFTDINTHILSVRNSNLQVKDNVIIHSIYTSSKLSFIQKVKLVRYLILNKDAIDIYHFMFRPSSVTSWVSKLVSKLKKVTTILTIPNMFTNAPIEKNLFGDYIITISNHSNKKLHKKGFSNVKRIRPGVDLSEFKPKITTSITKKFTIFYGGDLFYIDFDNLIRLVNCVRKKENNFKIIISARQIGKSEKELYQKLQKKIYHENLAQYVELRGFIPNIQTFLNEIDVHIFPVRWIAAKYELPLILIETMACGKPIIVPNIKPLDELIVNKNGYLISPGDVLAMGDSLIELIHNEKKRSEMGKKGRELVEKEYNIRKIAKEYEDLYMEISNERR